ncbi:MAG TPA: hypothetical protein VGM23_01620 [Armatimonadota bacterium]|jgi:hypothetical protein
MIDQLLGFFNHRKRPGMRLLHYLQDRKSLQAFIGMPPSSPRQWVKVVRVDSGKLRCKDSQLVDPKAIQSFIVAYSNGELLDCERPLFPWPSGIHEPEQQQQVADTITLEELNAGERFARLAHSPSTMPKVDKHYYSTTLTNIISQRIKVIKFAAYLRDDCGVFRLRTITGGYFTAEQFRAWYGLDEREWLEPGQSATDPENYGGPGALWVYFCRTETGEDFAVGAVAR